MYNQQLSGNVRYRLGFFGGLILQVEYARGNGPEDSNGMATYLSAEGLWRDAEVTDLNALGKITATKV